jgi:hypothetical protein
MYKLFTVTVVACICSAIAFPQNPQPSSGGPDAAATLLQSLFSDDGLGNFNYLFETSNGIKQNAEGTLKDIQLPASESAAGGSGKGSTQKGSFSYTAPDGTPIKVDWIADENGFQPTGTIDFN